MNADLVKVFVRYRDAEGGPGGETPWAEPIDANDGGGTFRLQNDLFFAPLRHGDVVRCELDADSMLQIVAIVDLVPGVLLGFEHPRDSDDIVASALEGYVAAGYEVTRHFDGFVEVFMPGAWLDDARRFAPIPAGWQLVARASAAERLAEARQQLDFALNETAVLNHEPVDYWAADDAAWAQLGVDEPEALSAIQTLAAADPRVLATIKADRHRDVLTYMERLATVDPRDLPALDRPLLVDPDVH